MARRCVIFGESARELAQRNAPGVEQGEKVSDMDLYMVCAVEGGEFVYFVIPATDLHDLADMEIIEVYKA